jgi:hypothetical protein
VEVLDALEELLVGDRLVRQIGREAPNAVLRTLIDDLPVKLPVDLPLRLLRIGDAVVAEDAVGVAPGLGLELDRPREVRDGAAGQPVRKTREKRGVRVGQIILVELEFQESPREGRGRVLGSVLSRDGTRGSSLRPAGLGRVGR